MKISVIRLCFLLVVYLGIQSYKTNTFHYDFEGEKFQKGDIWNVLETCCEHSYKYSSDQSYKGKKSVKFELRRNDKEVHNSKRSEFAARVEKANGDNWYRFRMFIPENWETDPKSFDIITQWHGYPDFNKGETWRSPPLSMIIKGNKIKLKSQWDSQEVTVNNTPEGKDVLWKGNLDKLKGKWVNWTFHIKWSHSQDGIIEVWKNQEKIVSHEGANTYNDERGVYLKIGLYKPDWKYSPQKSIVDTRIIYFDDLEVGYGEKISGQ